ncbi:hypothetical protein BT93_L0752 [Corymbia citriodora subsp. variegata]|uniref:Nucleolar protein 16 n=1 Tax=Corymbia citriodora subsp. variegata TaxID=360336 RepID=A0A8T0CEG9_CORYI|nr:hypothetical protein BT93_L0752 [Corymbia citriodora subsp. variegata]
MGRELQKKKNRSSVAKVRQKPKSKKKILNNPIIAANWNQKETLSQNYRRLGLASKLNHPTGGVDKTATIAASKSDPTAAVPDKLNIDARFPKTLDVSEVRIERDPETGAILRVLDSSSIKANPLNDPLNDLDDSDEEGWEGFVNEHGLLDGAATSTGGKTAVVQELEEQAAMPVVKKPRKASGREGEWLQDLVDKYGEDYAGMSRDMKMNPMQQSAGDLKRRIKKWKGQPGKN